VFGILLTPNVAASPGGGTHLTQGDAVAGFNAGICASIPLTYLAPIQAHVAAPYDGFTGRVNPVSSEGTEVCIEEWYIITLSLFTYAAWWDINVAKWYAYLWDHSTFDFFIKSVGSSDWIPLTDYVDIISTGPRLEVGYVYFFTYGAIVEPGQIPIGDYDIMLAWHWDGAFNRAWYGWFTVSDCDCAV
jgi:hypothetical protein